MKTLIKNATLINTDVLHEIVTTQCDVFVENGLIRQVAPSLLITEDDSTCVIDLQGNVLLPGLQGQCHNI